jgi:hypothetical protein
MFWGQNNLQNARISVGRGLRPSCGGERQRIGVSAFGRIGVFLIQRVVGGVPCRRESPRPTEPEGSGQTRIENGRKSLHPVAATARQRNRRDEPGQRRSQ